MTGPHGSGDTQDLDGSVAELVQRLSDGLRQLTRRVDDHEDQILDTLESLAAELDTLRDELDGKTPPGRSPASQQQPGDAASLRGTADSGDKPPVPRRWAARATAQDWDVLVDWVDQLRGGYSLPNSYVVPPCWPAHPGVVEELAALYRAWTNAVLVDEQADNEGSSAIAAWHDRWLWPTLQRFKIASYRITNCSQTHVPESTTGLELTNRTLTPFKAAPLNQ